MFFINFSPWLGHRSWLQAAMQNTDFIPVAMLTVQPHCAAIPVRKTVRHFGESQGYQGEIKDQEKLHFLVSAVQKSSQPVQQVQS